MKNGLQNQLTAMGESSCYFLCLCKIAEEVIGGIDLDVIKAFDDCVAKQHIRFQYTKPDHGDNCFVDNPVGCLTLLTHKPWKIHIIRDTNQIKAWKAGDNEYTIQRWNRKTTGREFTHFRRPSWDSLLDSQTVKHGAIDALYIFTLG